MNFDHKDLTDFIKNIFEKNEDTLKYFEDNYKYLHISLYKSDNLYFLKPDILSDNLIHTDKMINFILHSIEYIIFDFNFNFIYIKDKKQKIEKNSEILNKIKDDWANVKIYNYNVGIETIIFTYENQQYYVNLNEPYLLRVDTNKHLLNLIEKSNIHLKNDEINEIIISSHKISHMLYYKNNALCDNIYLFHGELLHYSGLDELIFDLENISSINEHKKKLTLGGYIINYNNTDYILPTYIYQKIKDMMPNYVNINKCYIELYKNDNLSFIINYMSPYPADIIKRINSTFKTLSRELLNIYHITRKKANANLYNILSNNYRTILFDLHKIFIYTRKGEEPKSLNYILNNDDEFTEKKSLNHEIIYKYIKKINTEQIINILVDRIELIKEIENITIDMSNIKMNTTEFKILFSDCIFTKTMSHLLKF